jgi:hypothetical protein
MTEPMAVGISGLCCRRAQEITSEQWPKTWWKPPASRKRRKTLPGMGPRARAQDKMSQDLEEAGLWLAEQE